MHCYYGVVYGFEASLQQIMAPNNLYYIIIHINIRYQDTATAATMGFQGKVDQPILVVPETMLGTTIISMFGAGGAFLGANRYRKHKLT